MFKFMYRNVLARNIILFLIIAALASYVLVSFGSAPPSAQSDTIAELGSTPIKYRDAFIQQENISSTYSQLPEDFKTNFIISGLMTNAVLVDGAEKADITVSKEELRDYVIRNRTTSEGVFVDDEQWSNFIKGRYRMQVETFETYLQDHELKINKYRQLFLDSAYVPQSKVEKRFREDNQKVKLEMLVLNTYDIREETKFDDDNKLEKFYDENLESFLTGDLRQVRFVAVELKDFEDKDAVTPEQVAEYYETNKERYRQNEQVTANHILIKTESRSDAEAKAEIERIKGEIESGMSFTDAANKYTEDDSGKGKGGALPPFQRGRMVKPFEDKAFTMAAGEISEPVKTQFGYHLIQKLGHQPESLRPLQDVEAGIRNNLARDNSKELATQKMDEFKKLVNNGKSMDEAAAEMGLTVEESTFFDNDNRSNMGDKLRTNFRVRQAVFALAALNDITEPLDGGSQIVVAQWTAEKQPEPLAFPADKARIKSVAEKIAGKKFIEKVLGEIKAAAEKDPSKSFKDLKGDREYLKENHFKTTEWVGANSLPAELRRDGIDFENDIYALEPGQFVDGMESNADTRMVLARVSEKQEPDMAKLEEERANIVSRLRSENGGELLSSYIHARTEQYDPADKVRNRIQQAIKR